jgi:Tfp pilus assembly protein PilF/TolB-like protein
MMLRTFAATLVALLLTVPQALVRAQAPVAASGSRVLVLPFENPARDPKVYWLAEGAAVLLTEELTARGLPAIRRDERLEAFERLQVPPIAALSRATVIRLGEIVGAGEVVIGSLSLGGDTLEVHARRIDIESGRLEGERIEKGPLAELFPIFKLLAPRVLPAAANIVAPLRQHPVPIAFENYIKGLIAENAATQISYLQAAIKAAPSFDQARLALWNVHAEQGSHLPALEAALQVPESSGGRREAQFLAALSEIRLARYDSAFSRLMALQKELPSGAVLNNLGVVQLRRGGTPETGRATYYFAEALKAVPDDPEHAFNLGYAYWMEGDPQAAIYWLREAVKLNPADGEAHAVLAAALQGSGAPTEATRERELARQLSSEYAEWEKRPGSAAGSMPRGLERVTVHIDRPRRDSIDLALLEQEQREQREVAAFHLDRGRRFFEQGEDRDAIAELRRSLYLSPYQADAHLLLGRIYLREARVGEAINALTISVWSQEMLEARIALAEAYLAAADLAAARREVDRALVLAPDSAEAKVLVQRLDARQAPSPK